MRFYLVFKYPSWVDLYLFWLQSRQSILGELSCEIYAGNTDGELELVSVVSAGLSEHQIVQDMIECANYLAERDDTAMLLDLIMEQGLTVVSESSAT